MPGIDECLLEAMGLPGARGAALVEWTTGLALGTLGASPTNDHETTAVETAELARMAAEHTAFALTENHGAADDAKGSPVEDVIVTTPTSYHLLHFVDTAFDSSVFFHLWLDRDEGNLALARIRLQDLAERLVLG